MRMTKFKAIDYFRKTSRTSYAGEEHVALAIDQQRDNEFLSYLEAKDTIDFLARKLEERYGQKERILLELILQHPGKLAPVAEQLNISKDEARKRKQRIMRWAKRILLNANQS